MVNAMDIEILSDQKEVANLTDQKSLTGIQLCTHQWRQQNYQCMTTESSGGNNCKQLEILYLNILKVSKSSVLPTYLIRKSGGQKIILRETWDVNRDDYKPMMQDKKLSLYWFLQMTRVTVQA